MSKVLRVSDGSYRLVVAENARITLDVGPGGRSDGEGTVYITGDLVVEGVTSTIETINTTIEDNIIVLNNGESGSGITRDSGTSGLRVDRGNYIDALWVFDEGIIWTDTSDNNITRRGTWSPRTIDGRILGIETVSITTDGHDLNLLGRYNTSGGIEPNPGKVTVTGVGSEYHTRMSDDNDIPNKKYVDLSIQTFFENTVPNRIAAGQTPDALSLVRVYDNSVDGGSSKVQTTIDGIIVQESFINYTNLYGMIIEQTPNGTEIKTDSTSDNDLILGAMGTGQVVIDDNLRIQRIGHEGDDIANPAAIPVPQEGITIYSNYSNAGGSGLYFVNESAQRDELISRNRALVYSMLF